MEEQKDPQQYYAEEEEDEEGPDNSQLWKAFGKETDLGKQLYGIYGARQKPKINYPPVKTKKQPLGQPKVQKACPQMTQIEYPEMEHKGGRKFHPVDFIPKRKAGEVILGEIEDEKAKPLGRAPGALPQDRGAKIRDMQDKFEFRDQEELERHLEAKRQAKLLDSVMPRVDPKAARRRRLNPVVAQKALQHYEEKYGRNPGMISLERPKTKEQYMDEQAQQLEDLFETIIEEIEERQEHIEAVGMTDKKIENRLKHEIAERIGELQRVCDLQKKRI